MALTCLAPSIKAKMIEAIKSGDLNFEALYDMSSADRNSTLAHYVGEDSAKLVNATYEKAKITGMQRAMADYVTASKKGEFAQTATKGEFAKNLLSDEAKKNLTLGKINEQLQTLKNREATFTEKLNQETDPEKKANLQYKVDKLKDQQAQLQARADDTAHPLNDKLVAKINAAKNLLDPGTEKEMMDDLIESKMGAKVTPAQGKYIVDRATKLQEYGRQMDINPSDPTAVSNYINTKTSLENYINSLAPHSRALGILGNLVEIGRDGVLGLSAVVKTTIGTVESSSAAIITRISHLSATGDNASGTRDLFLKSGKVFQKTGVEKSSLQSLDDVGSILGSHAGAKDTESFGAPPATHDGGVLGKVETATGTYARFLNTLVIKYGHGKVFSYFYRHAFYDTLNMEGSRMAKLEGLKGTDAKTRAMQIITDADAIEPKTAAGKILRANAQERASAIMNVNKSWASNISTGVKNLLNKAFGDKVPVGSFIEPVSTIAANVIKGGIDMSAVGGLAGAKDIIEGRIKMSKSGATLEDKYMASFQYGQGIERVAAVIGSMGLAALIVNGLTSKNFRSDTYGNHFLQFGDEWINTEYFSRLGPNIAGMMALKQNPHKNLVQATTEYLIGSKPGEGVLGSILNIPGVNVLSGTASGLLSQNLGSTLLTQAEERLVTTSALDMFKTNPIEHLFFGANGFESLSQVAQDNVVRAQKAANTRRADTLRAQQEARAIQTQ